MKNLYNVLIEKQLTISFAESITGGLLSSELTAISGASNIFKGSIIAYSNEVKEQLLKINKKDILKYSVVSFVVSELMAKGLKDIIESDIYVSTTGNAGPSLQENTYKFNAFYTIIYKNIIVTKEIIFINNNREENIRILANSILKSIIDIIL